MEILQFAGFALTAVVLLAVLRQQRPEMAVLVSLAAGAIIFVVLLDRIGEVIHQFREFAERASVAPAYLGTVLKIIGIAYIAEFAAQVCRDSGEGAMAAKVELAGKVLVLLFAVPLMAAILDLVLRMLPEGG